MRSAGIPQATPIRSHLGAILIRIIESARLTLAHTGFGQNENRPPLPLPELKGGDDCVYQNGSPGETRGFGGKEESCLAGSVLAVDDGAGIKGAALVPAADRDQPLASMDVAQGAGLTLSLALRFEILRLAVDADPNLFAAPGRDRDHVVVPARDLAGDVRTGEGDAQRRELAVALGEANRDVAVDLDLGPGRAILAPEDLGLVSTEECLGLAAPVANGQLRVADGRHRAAQAILLLGPLALVARRARGRGRCRSGGHARGERSHHDASGCDSCDELAEHW